MIQEKIIMARLKDLQVAINDIESLIEYLYIDYDTRIDLYKIYIDMRDYYDDHVESVYKKLERVVNGKRNNNL